MAGLEGEALAALQNLATEIDPKLDATDASLESHSTDDQEHQGSISTDGKETDPHQLVADIAVELLGHHIDTVLPLAAQGAGDLDIWALVSKIEQELGVKIPDSVVTDSMSLKDIQGFIRTR